MIGNFFDFVEPSDNGEISPGTSSFYPIPELMRPNGDLYLYYLSAPGVVFYDVVLDPWYKAELHDDSDLMHLPATLPQDVPMYRKNEPGSPLACFEQHQLCFFPSSPAGMDGTERRCSPLLSSADVSNFPQVIAEALQLHSINSSDGYTDEMLQGLLWTLRSTIRKTPRTVHPIASLGNHALKSRMGLNGGKQAPLPDNQWQLDVQHWHATVMAALQGRFVNSAIGMIRSHPYLEPVFRFASTPAEKRLCQQKTHAVDYISFNMFGIGTILIIGAVIVLVSFVAQPILASHTSSSYSRRKWIKRLRQQRQQPQQQKQRQQEEESQGPRSCSHTYPHYEWVSNETLQLQRLAHDGIGIGTWSGAMETVPRTEPKDELGVLDFSRNPRHPKLRFPVITSEITSIKPQI